MTDPLLNETVSSSLKPSSKWLNEGRKQLAIVLAIVLVSLFLWDTIFIYPIKVFVVFLHEISHGIAAIVTGGEIVELKVFENQGGLALTRGGIPFIITSSGYLGSMIWGGALFLTAMKRKRVKAVALFVAVSMLLITLLFVRNNFGFVFGLIFSLVMGFAALKLPIGIVQTVVQWLGALSCLYALLDIKEDLLTFERRQTDAQILADMTGIPAIVWGVLWGGIALVVFYFITKLAWKRASLEG